MKKIHFQGRISFNRRIEINFYDINSEFVKDSEFQNNKDNKIRLDEYLVMKIVR